jgi:hypothetical protein
MFEEPAQQTTGAPLLVGVLHATQIAPAIIDPI